MVPWLTSHISWQPPLGIELYQTSVIELSEIRVIRNETCGFGISTGISLFLFCSSGLCLDCLPWQPFSGGVLFSLINYCQSWGHDYIGQCASSSENVSLYQSLLDQSDFQMRRFEIWQRFGRVGTIQGCFLLLGIVFGQGCDPLNLFHCRIIQQVSRPTCVFCGSTNDSSLHLFRICNLFLRFQYRISRWLWWDLAIPPKLFCLISVFYLIWKSQNFAVFSYKTMFVSFCFYQASLVSFFSLLLVVIFSTLALLCSFIGFRSWFLFFPVVLVRQHIQYSFSMNLICHQKKI